MIETIFKSKKLWICLGMEKERMWDWIVETDEGLKVFGKFSFLKIGS